MFSAALILFNTKSHFQQPDFQQIANLLLFGQSQGGYLAFCTTKLEWKLRLELRMWPRPTIDYSNENKETNKRNNYQMMKRSHARRFPFFQLHDFFAQHDIIIVKQNGAKSIITFNFRRDIKSVGMKYALRCFWLQIVKLWSV